MSFPKGLSESLPFDAHYTMDTRSRVGNRFPFDGYTNSRIEFDSAAVEWRLVMLTGAGFSAVTRSGAEYPLGTRVWNVTAPPALRDALAGERRLNLYSCDDSAQFACSDGVCVRADKRFAISGMAGNERATAYFEGRACLSVCLRNSLQM